MAKKREPINQEKSAWDIVQDCVSQADISDLKLTWQFIQEFLRKNFLIYLDNQGKRIVKLSEGTVLPGTNFQISGTINAPVDPHITTLDNGITAKAYANIPFLIPQVRAQTSEDEDEDAAINSTRLLMYYHDINKEEELYKRIIGWLKPAGNTFTKDYWDKSKGDWAYVLDPLTGERKLDLSGNPIIMRDKNGRPLKTGDITSKVNAPQKMLIPSGIPYDEDLPWIGEENAKPVDEIFDIWGIKVEEESNLEDLDSLSSSGGYGYGQQSVQLKGHARVREIYFKPSNKYPYGRLIIASNKQILYDSPWDKALTERYQDEWHPYTHIGYKRIEGDYWYKTQFEYLADLQIQLNKIFKQIMDALKYVKGCFVGPEGAVDWETVNWDSKGMMSIEYKPSATTPPQFVQMQIAIGALVQQYNSIINRMNDIAANYEVSRGNNIPGVTSGKQVQSLQAANSLQVSPLLGGIAAAYIRRCQKKLRLCAVHFEDTGRLVRITGEENEAIAFTFTPDQIKSEDIVIANGPWFFMDPIQRQQKVDQLYGMGALGDPNNPMTKKRYLWLQGIGGGLEEVYADATADIRMAKAENQMFKKGELWETDQVLIESHPLMQQYQMQLQQWQQVKMVREGMLQELSVGNITPEQMGEVPPPPEPGPEPIRPKIYRIARQYEDHTIHIQIHNQLRKSSWFEKSCLIKPELRKAIDFHVQMHMNFLTPQQPPPSGGLNISGPPIPPTGSPGLPPPVQPGIMGVQ